MLLQVFTGKCRVKFKISARRKNIFKWEFPMGHTRYMIVEMNVSR